MERAAGSCHRFVCGPKKDKIFQIAQNGRVLCGYYAHDAGLGFRSDCLDTLAPLLSVTKAGIILLSIGFMLPVLSYGRLLRLYYGLKTDCSNVDYMSNLLKIKKQEHRQQHIVLNLYFLFLSLGFSLYTYEYTFHHSSPRGIIAYSVLLSWISLNWFVFRPYIIKKRNRRFSKLVKCIESHRDILMKH